MSQSRRSNEQSPGVQSAEAAVSRMAPVKLPGGVEFQLPHWAIAPFALIVLLGLVGYLTKLMVIPMVDDWQKQKELTNRLEYEQQRQRNEQQRVDQQLAESAKHIDEDPAGKLSFDAVTRLNLYKSDGCLLVIRGSGNNESKTFIPDLQHAKREPAPSKSASEPSSPSSGQVSGSGALPWEGTALAQVHGKCLNPHPGTFRQWTGTQGGDRRNCWVRVYRQWPDGCKQSQWFDTCYNVWDSNPNGSSKVTWEVCKH